MIHPDGLENVLAALLKSTITEYDNALKYFERHTEPEEGIYKNRYYEKERTKGECEQFFRSGWFGWLYDIDPERLISTIRARDRSHRIDWEKGIYDHNEVYEDFSIM